jgi:predicted phosphodiesterase
MTSFQIISDIHIEKMYPKPIDISTILKPSSKNLIIAGDVGRYSFIKEYYEKFLIDLCLLFEKVYFVPGNHEYYSDKKTINDIKFDFLYLKNNISNLYILDDTGIDIEDTNIRLYGTTLWSKIPDHYIGFRPILYQPYKQVNTVWMNLQHYSSLFMLEKDIQENVFNKKIVIISHYPPLNNGVLKDVHLKHPQRFYYSNNLKYILGKQRIHTWISGHTHHNFDFFEKGTRIVSNQYKAEGYISDKVVIIE